MAMPKSQCGACGQEYSVFHVCPAAPKYDPTASINTLYPGPSISTTYPPCSTTYPGSITYTSSGITTYTTCFNCGGPVTSTEYHACPGPVRPDPAPDPNFMQLWDRCDYMETKLRESITKIDELTSAITSLLAKMEELCH